MLNRSGITTETATSPTQILANVELQESIGCIVPQALGATVGSKKIVKAGTPIVLDFTNRQANAAATVGPTLGVFTLQITTAFATDEVLTIDGTAYTCAATEDTTSNKFAGATAAAQVTSLLKMVTTDDYDVAAVSGATDKIGFTQKTVDTSDTTGPTVTKTATTGAIGSVTKVTDPDAGTTGNAVVLHDVDVTSGAANATALLFGFVNFDRLDTSVQSQVALGINTIGAVSFIHG